MTRATYTRAAALWLLGIGLLSLATLYAQMALWTLSAALGVGAVLCVNTALYVTRAPVQRRARAISAELQARPDLSDAIDGCAAVALAAACCEQWWTSCGFEHARTCPCWREPAR